MSAKQSRPPSHAVEIESTERWVAGKSEEELLSDLKVYLARLRDDPRSIVDRLRVAAIQLRLGRIQEALIHYEGVLRGYVSNGQVMSAIALCQRILSIYPEAPRIQRILAALYARAPRGVTGAPAAVTPVEESEDQTTSTFVLAEEEDTAMAGESAPGDTVVDRVFPDVSQSPMGRPGEDLLGIDDDFRPTLPFSAAKPAAAKPGVSGSRQKEAGGSEQPVLLTQKKSEVGPLPEEEPDSSEVVLLTHPKKKG